MTDFLPEKTESLAVDTNVSIIATFIIVTSILFLIHSFTDAAGPAISNLDVVAVIQHIHNLNLPAFNLELAVALQTAIMTNSLSILNIDLQSALNFNFDCLHIIIYHSIKQYIIIAKFNIDYTITIYAKQVIDSLTGREQLDAMTTQIENIVRNLEAAKGSALNLKLTIFCLGNGDFFSVHNPFFPFADILRTHTWNLFIHVCNQPDIFLFLTDVGNYLNMLSGFLTFLVEKGNYCFNMALAIPSDELGEDTGSDVKAITQAIRYIETIHNIYSPIESIDSEFATIMEED